jgi:hypothetical protein
VKAGFGGLTLQRHWRMMGALEAADGMLLFGISTAYIFAVIQVCWPVLSGIIARRRRSRPALAVLIGPKIRAPVGWSRNRQQHGVGSRVG